VGRGILGTGEELEELKQMGTLLDKACRLLEGETPAVFLAETLLRVRGRDGRSFPLRPNRVQLEFERRRRTRNVVLKARQMGLSTWIAGRFFLKTITQPGTLTLEVAHTQEAAEDLFRMVHRFYRGLPECLRDGPLKTSRANARSLVFPRIDSEYRVETAGDPNAGRGLTVQNLHCSEVARWPGNAADVLAGLRASLPPHGEVALESTANGAYGCFYDEWMHAHETGYVQHFFPWWWEPKYAGAGTGLGLLDEAEQKLVGRHGLSLEQIGFRRSLQRQFGRLMQQEYPENADACFPASGACVFDVKAIDRRLATAPEPVERRWNGGLEVWYPAVGGKRYVVAVDPAAGGSDGDYCAMQVIERATGLQCAEFRGRIGLLEIAQRTAELATEYNQALVAVERNNHGHAVLAYLRSVCGYAPLFAQDGVDGWLTTSLTRPAMLEQLGRVLVEQPEVLNSRRLLQECRTFVRDAVGRMEAAQGEHDDCLMAMGVGLGVRGAIPLFAIGPR
jgi:hypothetical protein